ncbi:cardiac phospholamban isoform X1 [Prinia subflava]|uniref:cardiac phospholamban isoform X1 n=1 Tax=Prinia subflava TaxID=208062 RepID=UPI002FE29F91
MQLSRFPHPVIEQVPPWHTAPFTKGKPTSIISTTRSQTRTSCQRSTSTSHSPEQAPLCFTRSHQRWVTAPWRINKQAPQRLSKAKRRY